MKTILTAALLVIPASVSAGYAGGAPQTVFQCSFGRKEVVVSRAGSLYLYSFGLPGKPEVQVVGDPKRHNVFETFGFGTLDGGEVIRIANGRYSYAVYYQGALANYQTRDATDGSGLAVFDGKKRISRIPCKAGMGFQRGWNNDSDLPKDNDDEYVVDTL